MGRGALAQLAHLLGADHGDAAVVRPGVRLEHERGLRAERAVGEELEAADAQPVVAEAGAQAERERGVELVAGQAGADAQGELAGLAQPLERGPGLGALHGADADQAELVGAGDGAGDRGVVGGRGRTADGLPHELGGALLEDAGRLAGVVAPDRAAGRGLGVAGDAGAAERGGVDPEGVVVVALERDRAVGDGGVEVGAGWPAGPGVGVEPGAEQEVALHPMPGDARDGRLDRFGGVEVGLGEAVAEGEEVDVCVDQTGNGAAAGEVEDLGVGADQWFDVGFVAEGEDLLAEGGQGADAGLRRLEGEDGAAADDQGGVGHGRDDTGIRWDRLPPGAG